MVSSLRYALVAVALASPAWSQQITKLLESNDSIGNQVVTSITHPIVDDAAEWGALVGLYNPNGTALVFNRVPIAYAGDPLASPPGQIQRLLSLTGARGALAGLVRLQNLPAPFPPSPFAILRNNLPVLVQGLTFDALGLPPGTYCRELGGMGSNGGNALVACVRTDLGEALVRFTYAGTGPATSATVDLATGQVLSDGSTVSALDFHDLGRPDPVNGRGDWMWWVLGNDGRERLVTRDRILVRSGDPSPVPGRSYVANHPNPQLALAHALNDFGGYAFVKRISGDLASDSLLVKNGSKLAQEGDVLPRLAPEAMTDLEPSAVCISNSGHVYWVAHTDGLSSHNLNVMRDLEPIVRVGETRVGNKLVTFLDAFSLRVSPSGRYLLVRVFSGLERMLVRIDLGASVPLESCRPNRGELVHSDGLVLPGRTLRFTLSATASVFSVVRLNGSLGEATPGNPCGIAVPFGELMLDPALRQPSLFVGFWNNVPLDVSVTLPPDPSLVNLEYFIQGSFSSPSRVVFTNAMKLVIGAL